VDCAWPAPRRHNVKSIICQVEDHNKRDVITLALVAGMAPWFALFIKLTLNVRLFRLTATAKAPDGLRTVKAIQKGALLRKLYVPYAMVPTTETQNAPAEPPAVVCKDCNASSTIESLISVDPLHVQCPHCLFVFFLESSARGRS